MSDLKSSWKDKVDSQSRSKSESKSDNGGVQKKWRMGVTVKPVRAKTVKPPVDNVKPAVDGGVNPITPKLGDVSHPKLRNKCGRPRSEIVRKQTMFSLSDRQKQVARNLEMQMGLHGIDITRGRSEVVELAMALLTARLSDTADKIDKQVTLKTIQRVQDQEGELEARYREMYE